MGRPIASVLAIATVLIAVAMLDRGRETDPPSPPLVAQALTEEEVVAPSSSSDAAFGGSLLDCLSDVAPLDSAAASPPLTPRGVDEIAARVELLRRLRFDGPVDVRFLTEAGINREVSGLIDEESDPALIRRQGEALELLGAIPPGSDLLELSRQALDSQVLGLFVPETQELLVSTSGKAGAVEAITVAHELDHALAFDALGLPIPEQPRPGNGDRDLAGLALVEGDATLLMSIYAVRYIPADEQLDLLNDPSLSSGENELAKLPHIIRAQLLFPYDAGLEYVCGLYAEGGWDAVDRAYANPPRSTAELLDPEGAEEPLEFLPPPVQLDEFQSSWRKTLDDEIGAAELSWLFEAPGDDRGSALPDAKSVAAEWTYGHIELWQRGDDSALSMQLSGSSAKTSLCGATIAWYRAAFPEATVGTGWGGSTTFDQPEQSASIRCSSGAVLVGIGPDLTTAQSLAS